MLEHLGHILRRARRASLRDRLIRTERLEDRTLLSTFMVASIGDNGPGTLRQALEDARNDPNPDIDTLQFVDGLFGTILLESELSIQSNLFIAGPGPQFVTIDGQNMFRVFVNSATATVQGLTLTQGLADDDVGGAIHNSGDLTLTQAVVRDSNSGRRAAAIYNTGSMLITNSEILDNGLVPGPNSLDPDVYGGAIQNFGMLTIRDSQLSGNRAPGVESGGVIENESPGTVVIERSTFTGNSASELFGFGGGAIHNLGSLTVTDSEFTGHGGTAAIVNYATASFTGSTFADNGSIGIFNISNGDLEIQESNFFRHENAVWNRKTARIQSSLFTENHTAVGSAAGGTFTFGDVLTLVSNSTISDNMFGLRLTTAGVNHDVRVTNTTLANNQSGIDLTSSDVTIHNTIVVGNTVDIARSGTSSVDAHFSLIGNPSAAGGVVDGVNGNIVGAIGTDVLHPLADYGGPMLTHKLKPGSPALNRGSNALAVDVNGNPLVFDQRGNGFPRIHDAVVDMGATELNQQRITDVASFSQQTGRWWVGFSDGDEFTSTPGPRWSTDVTWQTFTGDVNGDGLEDLIGRQRETGQWWVAVADGTRFITSFFGSWGSDADYGWNHVQVGDFNGDNRTDIVGMSRAGRWWGVISDGTRFHTVFMGRWHPTDWMFQVGDINGDGNDDLIGFFEPTGQWWAGFSTGSMFQQQFVGSWNAAAGWHNFQIGEFTGDNKQDVLAQTGDGYWYSAALNQNNRLQTTFVGRTTQATGSGAPLVNDFNGDGLDDIVVTNNRREIYVKLATGTGFTNTIFWGTTPANRLLIDTADVDANDRADLIYFNPVSGQWISLLSNGTQFTPNAFGTWTNIIAATDKYFTGEFGL